MADLFTDHAPSPQADGDTGDLDTVDVRATQFINRWGWKTDKAGMRRELDELIRFAIRQEQS